MDYFATKTVSGARSVDMGLRSYMLSVYNYMALALVLTGICAMAVGTVPALTQLVFGTGLFWLFALAPIGLSLIFSFRLQTMSLASAQMLFALFAFCMGVSLGSIFLRYTGESIARTFFITSATFGAMSLYGYTTKKDLTSWGSFLIMGLFGMIIASLVNLFLQSPAVHFITSVMGVIIFTGLIAYDTNRIKDMYYYGGGMTEKLAVYGALSLYMDFVNLFVHLLQFFGQRRD